MSDTLAVVVGRSGCEFASDGQPLDLDDFDFADDWAGCEDGASIRSVVLATSPKRLAVALTRGIVEGDAGSTVAESTVAKLLDEIEDGAAGRRVIAWQTSGEFVDAEIAREFPEITLDADWHALATWAGRTEPTGCVAVIRIESDGVDLVPVERGVPTVAPGFDGRVEDGFRVVLRPDQDVQTWATLVAEAARKAFTKPMRRCFVAGGTEPQSDAAARAVALAAGADDRLILTSVRDLLGAAASDAASAVAVSRLAEDVV